MRFVPTPLAGAFVIELDKRATSAAFSRDFFASANSAKPGWKPISYRSTFPQPRPRHLAWHALPTGGCGRGQGRALHQGRVVDAILDLRPGSATFGQVSAPSSALRTGT